jgi:hypothetical protein
MLATLQRIADMMNAPDVAHEPFLVHDPPSAGATADQGAAPPPDEEIDAVRSM